MLIHIVHMLDIQLHMHLDNTHTHYIGIHIHMKILTCNDKIIDAIQLYTCNTVTY